MTDKPIVSNCGACFGTRINVVEEAYIVDIDAFGRFSQLLREGRSPQLCQKSCGTYFVCHLDPEAGRKKDQEG